MVDYWSGEGGGEWEVRGEGGKRNEGETETARERGAKMYARGPRYINLVRMRTDDGSALSRFATARNGAPRPVAPCELRSQDVTCRLSRSIEFQEHHEATMDSIRHHRRPGR